MWKKKQKTNEDYYLASQWTLMGRKLKKHKLAKLSMLILLILYLGALFADFLARCTRTALLPKSIGPTKDNLSALTYTSWKKPLTGRISR